MRRGGRGRLLSRWAVGLVIAAPPPIGLRVQKTVTVGPGMARRRRRSHAFALHFARGDRELGWLSPEGRSGLAYARRLAENARERSAAALSGDLLPERLTVAALAEADWVSPSTIRARIRQARIELFGKDLGERAVCYRLRARRQRTRARRCAEEGCRNPLPRHAAANRAYCDEHASPAARVRRHRNRRRHR